MAFLCLFLQTTYRCPGDVSGEVTHGNVLSCCVRSLFPDLQTRKAVARGREPGPRHLVHARAARARLVSWHSSLRASLLLRPLGRGGQCGLPNPPWPWVGQLGRDWRIRPGPGCPGGGLGGNIWVNGVFLCAHQFLQFCDIDSIWTRSGCCPLSSLLWRSSASESVSSSQRPQGG